MSLQSKITSKGQITLPAKLRERLALAAGDAVEFYFDHAGRVCMRPKRAGVAAFLGSLPPRKPRAFATDDDAISSSILRRDARARSPKGRG